MRSEAEIRSQVEKRFHRWVFLLLNGGAWAAISVGLYLYYRANRAPEGWIDSGWVSSATIIMLLWGIIVGLHFLRTVYVETREWLVGRAVDREIRDYTLREMHQKRKRDDALPYLTDEREQVDFPSEEEAIGDAYAKRR